MKRRKKGQKLPLAELTKSVLSVLGKRPDRAMSSRQIHKKTRAGNNVKDVRGILTKLAKSKAIRIIGEDLYQAKEGVDKRKTSSQSIVGQVDMIRSGAAFIISEQLDQDVFVPQRYLHTAQNGDEVEVILFKRGRGRRAEGKVTRIVRRNKTLCTGVYRKYKNHQLVHSSGRKNNVEIMITGEPKYVVNDFDKVVVRITHWPEHSGQNLRGIITQVLGTSGDNEAEMLSLLVDQGFELTFPSAVEKEAAQLVEEATFEVSEKRLDYRDVLTMTIDPADAKDFDDALSYQVLENGHIEIGIHIADVSHYVRPNSALDKDAAKRGNSVYLVDRTLPMLPENLSNGLCSLRPDEEKYTFSVICQFNDQHQLVKHRISKTLIKSDQRFAYEQAQELIEGGKSEKAKALQKMNSIAHTLRKKRTEEGSIGFETEEVRFKLDEDGKPVSVYIKRRKDAHLMIEDYMLLANKLVAKYIAKKGKSKPIPFPYRIHDQPDEVKLHDFSLLAREFGIQFNFSTPQQVAESMNELMAKAKEDDRYKILVPMAIRSMAKAEYNTENIGHFGLAFEHYCHFTSPIRRYADLIVHRVLFENLYGSYYPKADKMDAICTHISGQERKAQEAERESVKYKQAEYLKAHEGEVFEGTIVSIIDRGFFVTLKENLCEGMVSFESLGERYDVDPLNASFIGRRSGRSARIGDSIYVRVEHADLFTRRVDLLWVEEVEE